MRVRVLYFGVLKERMGREGETLEIAEGMDVAALYDQLREGASKREAWPPVAVAVNREYAGLATVLREGDEVALLPPVSGGCYAHGEKRASLARECKRPGRERCSRVRLVGQSKRADGDAD